MKFSYYNPSKSYDGSLYQNVLPKYEPVRQESFSLDSILNQESYALLDKAVNTALSISYRLKLYDHALISLESRWNDLSSKIGELYSFGLGNNMNIERRKSMLEKERSAIEFSLMDHRLQTWKDLNEPTNYFVGLWHKGKELKQDRNLLGE